MPAAVEAHEADGRRIEEAPRTGAAAVADRSRRALDVIGDQADNGALLGVTAKRHRGSEGRADRAAQTHRAAWQAGRGRCVFDVNKVEQIGAVLKRRPRHTQPSGEGLVDEGKTPARRGCEKAQWRAMNQPLQRIPALRIGGPGGRRRGRRG